MTAEYLIHIACIDNDFTSGVSTVVPQYIKYESKYYDHVCLFNLNECSYQQICDQIKQIAETNKCIVIFHEIYRLDFYLIARFLDKQEIKYAIIPHGSLTKNAQTQKQLAKKIINKLVVNSFIKNACVIQYLSDHEKKESGAFRCKKRIVIPNGTDVPCSKYSRNLPEKHIVFIGRLDIYVKGLDYLLETAKEMKNILVKSNVHIDIYGPDYKGSLEELDRAINKIELQNHVHLKGPLSPKDKGDVLSNAYAYIQLSRTEGFPTSVIEAMSYGVPIIVTEGTTWKDKANILNIGIGVEYDPKEIALKVISLLNNGDLRNELGKNARHLVISDYSWDEIAKKQIENYLNLLN